MALKYYPVYRSGIMKTPQNAWKDDFQEFVNFQFSNATDVATIEEEASFGSLSFSNVTVRLSHIINSLTSTNRSFDFKKIIFQDNDKSLQIGNRYRFDGYIWLATAYDLRRYESNAIVVRRCNQTLKWYNNEGALIEEPVVIDYLNYSGAYNTDENKNQTLPDNTRYILMQNNDYTTNLGYDTRFVFNKMTWKIVNFDKISVSGIIQITVEQDGIDLNKDDLTNEIAINTYPIPVYSIDILNDNIEVAVAGTMQLQTEVKVNGIVDNSVELSYSSSDTDIATVSASGLVTGIALGTATISVSLTNNSSIEDSITSTVNGSPAINTIEEIIGDDDLGIGNTTTYTIYKYIDGIAQADTYTFSLDNSLASIISYTSNTVTIQAEETTGTVIISAENDITLVTKTKSVPITDAW